MRFKNLILEQIRKVISSREDFGPILSDEERQELSDLKKVIDFLNHGIPIDD